jgi:hypothetical protein
MLVLNEIPLAPWESSLDPPLSPPSTDGVHMSGSFYLFIVIQKQVVKSMVHRFYGAWIKLQNNASGLLE